jgi:hypothetical protein
LRCFGKAHFSIGRFLRDGVKFQRVDLLGDLLALRTSRSAPERAIGDNFEFEERVSEMRREHFEQFDPALSSLLALQHKHFRVEIQGARRSHIPTTFRAINDSALYSPEIEPNQKLIRLERIDDILLGAGLNFNSLEQALQPRARDEALLVAIADQWKAYPGARPSFVAFKSEVANDLKENSWLVRLRNRLGLGHFSPAPGERQCFALMEYLVEDVLSEWETTRRRGAERPFAFPTVMEAPGSPHFFPAPIDVASSFTVDLSDAGRAQPPIRELLHIRISYRAHHLVRVGQLIGPLPEVKLAVVRDAHLHELKRLSGRTEFGAYMTGEVDE